MKLTIDIPEDVYTRLFDNGIQDNEIAVDDVCEMAMAIRKGAPLPKGHGRLIDGDIVLTWLIYKGVIGKLKCGEVASVFEKATIIEADGGDAE